jgi:signal transduction histidine kinase
MRDEIFYNTLKKKLQNSNEKSAYIISCIGLLISILLIILDVIRWKNGVLAESLGLSIAVVPHLFMFSFLIPILNDKYQFLRLKPIATFKTNALLVIIIMHFTVLPFAFISFYALGKLIIFTIFVIIINLFFETNIKSKLIFNFCLALVILLIPILMKKDLSLIYINILEIFSIVGFIFVFTKYRHQNRINSHEIEILLHKNNLLLQKQNDVIEEKNSELQSFAYAASHDLKEPLRMISSYTGLIEKRLDKYLTQSTREFMDFVIDGVFNMNEMLDDLLDYATLDSNEPQIEFLDLNDVILKVSHNLSTIIQETNTQINIKSELPIIKVNKTYASLLFQNLISNAIKFRQQDIQSDITIDCSKNKNGVIISIKDNGIGIPQKHLSSIFSIFNRLHEKEAFKGHGIGLATCKKIVGKLNGEIWVESQVDKGSCFFISLPNTL